MKTYRAEGGIISREHDGLYRAYRRGPMSGGPVAFSAWIEKVGDYRTLYGARMALRRASGPVRGVVLAS